MKKLYLYLLILSLSGFGLSAQVLMEHTPPHSVKSNQQLELNLNVVDGAAEVSEMHIFYRQIGRVSYENRIMDSSGFDDYSATISTGELNNGIEYYFKAVMKDNSSVFLPEFQPENNPFRITPEVSIIPAEGFVLLMPETNIFNNHEDFVIAVSFFALQNEVDLETLNLYLNNKNVTSMSTKSKNLILYKVKKPLPGSYAFQIKAKLKNGRQIVSPQWKTNVQEKKIIDFPFDYDGEVNMYSSLKSVSAEDSSRIGDSDSKKFAVKMVLNMKKNWLRMKSKLYLTSLNSSHSQPLNRYSFSLLTKYASLDLGDKNINFNRFTLNGGRIRGAALGIYTPVFRLKTVYGLSKYAIDGKIVEDKLESAGTFRRNTLGIRSEFGNDRYFSLGLNFVKSKDDKNSLAEEFYLSQDSLYYETPEDNLILGSDFIVKLFNSRVIFGGEIDMSFYNSNILDGAISKDSLASYFNVDESDIFIDPESFESFIVFNKYSEPIIPGRANTAFETYFRINMYRNSLRFSYSEVGPAYKSLPSSNLQEDQRKLTVTDDFFLMRNQLLVNLGYNRISDNLTDHKEYTSTTNSFFMNLIYRKTGLPYFRFGLNTGNTDGGNEYEYANTSANFGSGYTFKELHHPTSFRVDYILASRENKESYKSMRNYLTLSSKTDFNNLPVSTTISYSLSLDDYDYEELYGSDYNETGHNIFLKTDFSFLDDRLEPFGKLSYSIASDNVKNRYYYLIIGSKYELYNNLNLNGNVTFKNFSNDENDTGYNYVFMRLNCSYNF